MIRFFGDFSVELQRPTNHLSTCFSIMIWNCWGKKNVFSLTHIVFLVIHFINKMGIKLDYFLLLSINLQFHTVLLCLLLVDIHIQIDESFTKNCKHDLALLNVLESSATVNYLTCCHHIVFKLEATKLSNAILL